MKQRDGTMAILCIDYYLKAEELPTGHGIANVVFLPKRDTSLPAMIVELKWNQTAYDLTVISKYFFSILPLLSFTFTQMS